MNVISFKTLLKLAVGILCLWLIIAAVIHYSTTSALSITTDQQNMVDIQQLRTPDGKPAGAKAYHNSSTGNTSVRLGGGTYSVTVSDNHSSAQQTVIIKPPHSQKLTLQTPKLLQPEPVTDRAASSLVVGQSASFIDVNNSNLYTVTPDGNEALIDSSHSLNFIDWADQSYGLGTNGHSQLFEISGPTVTLVPLPSTFGGQPNVTFAVQPDRSSFISNGGIVYSRSARGDFKQVYTAPDGHTCAVLAARGGSVLIKLNAASDSGDPDSNGGYVLQDSAGIQHTYGQLSYEAALSPDAKHIALSGTGHTSVFDTGFNKLSDIPASNVNSIKWLNDHTLVYGVGSGLWEYDVTNGLANQLTDVGAAGNIGSVAPNQKGDAVYFLVQHTNTDVNHFDLSRVNLASPSASATMIKLGVFLPNIVQQCSMGYENFTAPTVVVHGPPDTRQGCLFQASEYLKLNNLSDPALRIVFSPGA